MSWLSQLLHAVPRSRKSIGKTPGSSPRRWRPFLEGLEDRLQPSGLSSIVSNFNGTPIAAGNTIWFSSVAKVSGVGANPVTLSIVIAEIDFSAAGTTYQVPVPNATITFSPTASQATTAYDPGSNTWVMTAPSNPGGNVFLAGVGLPLPSGLPGGVNPVTWTATFQSDTAGLTVNWQWAAAVYTNFSTDYTTVGVKPVDSNQLSIYHNSDHAGTPEAFKSFVVGGARGGGGSNWTGSYSGTGHVAPEVAAPPATLSGNVSDLSGNPIGSIELVLTNTVTGQQFTTFTSTSGTYTFTNLPAGSYMVQEIYGSFTPISATPGTDNGSTDGTAPNIFTITSITLGAGDSGVNYNFVLGRGE